jgi:hypothetical protein
MFSLKEYFTASQRAQRERIRARKPLSQFSQRPRCDKASGAVIELSYFSVAVADSHVLRKDYRMEDAGAVHGTSRAGAVLRCDWVHLFLD